MKPPYNHDRPPTPEEVARIMQYNTPPEALNLTPEELDRRTKETCDEIRRDLNLPPYEEEKQPRPPMI
ncbi:MAG: hypothetical protein NTV49_13555 [Kiritimatiellaeota bacterium]|nr:hypothetical protein [Kiritimatiellota bacterium]